ncbi:MAG: cyclic nucleotide-binding/CBS domain-containing protein [Candidatus Altarchaeaceae archaeon]
MAEIKVRDIMKKEIETIGKDESLMDAILKMAEKNIGCLIVRPDEKREPFGIITRKDIVNAYASGYQIQIFYIR